MIDKKEYDSNQGQELEYKGQPSSKHVGHTRKHSYWEEEA